MKNRAQRAQEQNRAQARPTGTAFLIGTKLISLAPWRCSPASSRSPWSAKTSQMGLLYPATPKIYNYFPPIMPNSERTLLPATSGIVYICLRSPALLHTPALSSGTLGILTTLPAHLKNPISNPTPPRHSGKHPVLLVFLAGWQLPLYMYQVVW